MEIKAKPLNPLKTASGLLELLQKEKAIKHADFVLSPDYGLRKRGLREFWEEVKNILKEEKLGNKKNYISAIIHFLSEKNYNKYNNLIRELSIEMNNVSSEIKKNINKNNKF